MRFDLKFLRSTLDYQPTKVKDTMIMSKLVGNASGSKAARAHGHGYADVCREYLNIHIDGKGEQQISVWGIGVKEIQSMQTLRELEKYVPELVGTNRNTQNDWWAEKLEYAANDVIHLFEVHDIMHDVITMPLPHTAMLPTGNTGDQWGYGMTEVLEREFEFIKVAADMEFHGLPMSRETLKAFQMAISEELISTAVYLSKELELDTPQLDWTGKLTPSPLTLKTLRSTNGLLEVIRKALRINRIDNVQADTLKRMVEIIDLLAKAPDPNTAEDVFTDDEEAELFAELTCLETSDLIKGSPVVSAILDFKKYSKQQSMDLTKYINPLTGRLHYSIDQLGTSTGRSSCIAEGQLVDTVEKGSIPIEQVRVGDLVWCFDELNRAKIRLVLNTWRKDITHVVKVNWIDSKGKKGHLLCTPDHKIKTWDQWVEARHLKRHTHLTGFHSVVSVEPAGVARVYDLEVEDYNNFICQEICVHNSSGPNMQQISGRTNATCVMELEKAWKC